MVQYGYRQDRDAILAALRRSQRPDWATTMVSGPLDELVALHQELGISQALDRLRPQRQRAGIDDPLLLRTLASLPLVSDPSLDAAAGGLVSRAGHPPATGLGAGPNSRRHHLPNN